jgi:hypothetical protein
MRGRVIDSSENEMYLDLVDQRPNSAPPSDQFQFPEGDSLTRNNNANWKSNNQPVASPLYDPSSSSRQVWSNNTKKMARPATMDNYHSKLLLSNSR